MSKKKEKCDLRLEMDRFFVWSREKFIKLASQNEKPTNITLLRKSGENYLYTTKPKRMYIIEDKFVDKGVKIYFKVKFQKELDVLKNELKKRFSDKYVYCKIATDEKQDYISGFCQIKNAIIK